jgi:hypothetical protein
MRTFDGEFFSKYDGILIRIIGVIRNLSFNEYLLFGKLWLGIIKLAKLWNTIYLLTIRQ